MGRCSVATNAPTVDLGGCAWGSWMLTRGRWDPSVLCNLFRGPALQHCQYGTIHRFGVFCLWVAKILRVREPDPHGTEGFWAAVPWPPLLLPLWPLGGSAWGSWALARGRWDRSAPCSVALPHYSVVKVGRFIALLFSGCGLCNLCGFATPIPLLRLDSGPLLCGHQCCHCGAWEGPRKDPGR